MKGRIICFILTGLFLSGTFLIPAKKALAEKLTGFFIVLKVDHVDSLSNTQDQKAIMERAFGLLQEQSDTLGLKSVELRKKANDIIILFYRGSEDPRKVAQALRPKDLVVSFTVVGIFKGQEISEDLPR